MKNKCNVAKDLMPLVIDGVASEESQQYVDEHIAECTECALTYGAMRVELPRANQEKERAEMEKAARKLRRKRILRGVIAAVVAISIFIGGAFAWREIQYRLTQYYSKTMALDEYSGRIVQTQAGNVIVCINLTDSKYLSSSMACHMQWAGINGNTKNVLEIEMLKTIIPQYLDGDDANIQKMLRTVFMGTVINGEWSNKEPWRDPYREDPRPEEQNYRFWDEVALISGDERKVIYTKGDVIPYCSEEMEAYYAAYHEKQPTGKTMPEWRVDLVKLLDATPEVQARTDEEYKELLYVCENGYLSLDALYYDVSRGESQNARVQVDLFSFPGGNLPFNAEHRAVPVDNDTGICVQYHIIYAPDDPVAGAGGWFWSGRIEDGVWLQHANGLRDENGTLVSLPIVRLELHAGDAVVVLWEEGDVLQTPQEATIKREAEEAKYKK